ncbi:hypothetical protein V6N13_023132 [Hibiscus sabdariffa]|uniref:Uncharacterized protein n=2 Tax=Hibiscus sabdariffa TaxID=183260 RepID=A0ABR2NWK6_9ROSI
MMKYIGRGNDSAADMSPHSYSSPSSALVSLMNGPVRPIRFVYYDENGKFRMDPKAVATLQLCQGTNCCHFCTWSGSSGKHLPFRSVLFQSVEEAECRRAYDSVSDIYRSTFDHTKPLEEVALREAHEEAIQRSLVVYNASVVGVGSMRKKYEELLHKYFRKEFEDGGDGNAILQANLELGSHGVAGNSNTLSEIVPTHSIPRKNHESTQAVELSGLSDGEEGCDGKSREERDDDEPNPKRREVSNPFVTGLGNLQSFGLRSFECCAF